MNEFRNAHGINDDRLESTIRELSRKGVRLWMENGTLRYRAPKGLITADDIAALHRLTNTQLSVLTDMEDGGLFQPRFVGMARPKRAPLSLNQLAHWQARATFSYRPIRDVVTATRIRGPMDHAALGEALATVVERHDSLRTNVVTWNSSVMQEVMEKAVCSPRVVDLTAVRRHVLDDEVYAQIRAAIIDVSDYSVDPLFVPVLMQLEKAEHILALALDHMVTDGISNGILEAEIFAAYKQLVSGRAVSLPVVQMQYTNYAIWQRAAMSDYFRTHDPAMLDWCRTRFPADARGTGCGGLNSVRFTVDGNLRAALESLARRMGTTLVMTALTAYVALVIRWCDVTDTVMQVMSSGRANRMTESIIGFVAYPLYLHVSAPRDPTFSELLEVVTKEYCQACEKPNFYHAHTLSPRPAFTRNTCFNWIPMSRGPREDDGGSASNAIATSSVVLNPFLEGCDMDVEPLIGFRDTGSEIAGFVEFSGSQFAVSTMRRFAGSFNLFLNAIAVSPTVRIRDIKMA